MPIDDRHTWREAWSGALYGPGGFSRRGGRGPRHDFSTPVTRGPALAQALAELLHRLHRAGNLGGEDFDVVDMGSGDGRLLADLIGALPPALAGRGRFAAVELAPRPTDLPAGIEWLASPPPEVRGLLIAHEYLDTVPCDVVERDARGVDRLVVVDAHGREALGAPVSPRDAAWLERWWPLDGPGQRDGSARRGGIGAPRREVGASLDELGAPRAETGWRRAEVGWPRDDAWSGLSARLTGGLAIAVDYGHVRGARPAGGTLRGWSRGRPVEAVPDGDCDLTAHVAMDACCRPGDHLMTQRAALRSLGVHGEPAAAADPRGHLLALAEASRRRSLLDPDGMGSYLWLVHPHPTVQMQHVIPSG